MSLMLGAETPVPPPPTPSPLDQALQSVMPRLLERKDVPDYFRRPAQAWLEAR